MRANAQSRPLSIVFRFIYAQIIVTLVIFALLWMKFGWHAAYSAAIAGAICVLTNMYFAWRVFKHKGARAAKKFVTAFIAGELTKLFLQGLLFVLALKYLMIDFKPFLLVYIVNLIIFWFAPFIEFGMVEK